MGIFSRRARAGRRRDGALPSLSAERAGLAGPDPFETYDARELLARTYLRLVAADAADPRLHPVREVLPGVVEVLALDLPHSVALWSHERLGLAGGLAQVRAAGLENLRRLPVEDVEPIEVPEGGTFTMMVGDSWFTASRALLLPELAQQVTGEAPSPHGWLVSVPNRHQLSWHAIRDGSAVAVVGLMAHLALAGAGGDAGAISPHLYWWDGTEAEQLTIHLPDQPSSIVVGPRFEAALNAVVG